MKHAAAFVTLIAALAACDADGGNEDRITCAALTGEAQCAGTFAEATAAWRATEGLGTNGAIGLIEGTVTEIGEGYVTITAGDGQIRFGWPEAVPEALQVGASARLSQHGPWQYLLAGEVTLAVLRNAGEEPLPATEELLPHDVVRVGYAEGCAWEGGARAVDLSVRTREKDAVLAAGQSVDIGGWTIRHLAGWVDPAPLPEVPDWAYGAPDCVAPPNPGPYAVAAIAVWRGNTPAGTCDAAAEAQAGALLDDVHFGIEMAGTLPEAGAPGVIEALDGDTVVVALETRGTARFRWTGELPAGLDPGDTVELRRNGYWDELHGDVVLAVRLEMQFVGGDHIEPALGSIPLGFAPLCTFVETDGFCGGPPSLAQVYGLELPDGSVLAPGEEGVVGEATIRHVGAVQWPGMGTNQCIVEAMFLSITSARAPSAEAAD